MSWEKRELEIGMLMQEVEDQLSDKRFVTLNGRKRNDAKKQASRTVWVNRGQIILDYLCIYLLYGRFV